MKKELMIFTAAAAVLTAQDIYFGEYQNSDLQNLSFTDSLVLDGVYKKRGVPTGTQGPVNGTDTAVVDTAPKMFTMKYTHDITRNVVIMNGKGIDMTFALDDKKRVVKITEGDIKGTSIAYGDNRVTVIESPNDTGMAKLNKHTKKWDTWYRPDGQVDKLVITPMDWEYMGEPFWADLHADTIQHTYDDQGRRIGVKKILWTTDFFHNNPWVRSLDSLTFVYGEENGKKKVTVSTLSPFGNTWIYNAKDTQWVAYYNEKNQIVKQIQSRYDASGSKWDSLYFSVSEYTWQDSLLTRRYENQFYGDGTKFMMIWDEKFYYGRNSLKYGEPVSVTKSAVSASPVQLIRQGMDIVLTGVNADRIVLYGLNGRTVREEFGKNGISLEGISRQPLIAAAFVNGKQAAVIKIQAE